MHVLDTLAPIFMIVLLGFALRRGGFLSDAATGTISRCCYWVGLPCLLFLKVAFATAPAGSALTATWLVLGATAVLVGAAVPVAFALRLRAARVGTFLQASARGNLAFVGLPVVIFAFRGRPGAEQAEAVAALLLGAVVVTYNVLFVVALLASAHRMTGAALRRVLAGLAGNPLIIACLAGIAWRRFAAPAGVALPPFLQRAMELLAAFPLPMALLCVGSTLAGTPVRGAAAPAVAAALLKTVAGPLIAVGLARAFGATPAETAVAAIMMATPTAVASYVLVEQLGGDQALAAGAIVWSTLASAVSLSVAVALL